MSETTPVRQYRLYENNTCVVSDGSMGHHGFVGNGTSWAMPFPSWEEGVAFIEAEGNLRWCQDFDQHESMSFQTWYRD